MAGAALEERHRDACVFVLAAVTDALDGYIARKYGMVSKLGEFLDPVADKLMVSRRADRAARARPGGFICRAGHHRARDHGFGAARMDGTDRQVEQRRGNSMGKIKTIAQMVAIPMLLFHDRLFGVIDLHLIGTLLIYVAAVLTVYSMLIYLRLAWPHLNDRSQ